MYGARISTPPRTIGEFIGLPGDLLYVHYIQIRRKRALFEQLSTWVTASIRAGTGAADQFYWHTLLRMTKRLELAATETNESGVKGAPDLVGFLVEACMKAVAGCDLSTDKEMFDHVMRLFAVEDNDRPSLTVLAHSLCGTPIVGRAVVPVAFVETNSRSGLLARLEVEIFAEGPAISGNHPAEAFEYPRTIKFMDEILASLSAAFLAASKFAEVKLCGRWRLIGWEGERRLPETLDGPSLGAAAARAWAFAFKKQKADPRVLVIAQVKESGALVPLEDNKGISLKVARACELTAMSDQLGPNAVDTVVVVGAANREAAQTAIDAAKAGERLRVVMLEEGSDNRLMGKAA